MRPRRREPAGSRRPQRQVAARMRARAGLRREAEARPIAAHTAWVNARFFAAAQHDFAARLQWSVTPTFKGANHEPLVKIDGPLAVRGAAAGKQSVYGDPS